MKIHDKNQKTNAIPKSTSAVDRIFGGATMVGKEVVETTVTQAGHVIYEIPLRLIRVRPVNNYSITGIDELAESIQRTGLWQPIIVRRDEKPDDERIYVIVAGERRYNAMKMLHDQAEKDNDSAREKIYSSIAGIILDENDLDKEEQIYHDTNDYSRQLTNFERITRLDPESIDMTKESWQERYIETCYGSDKLEQYKLGRFHVKGNLKEKCEYIVKLLTNKEPDLDITESTVRGYLSFLSRCGETLRQAVLKGIVPMRDARDYLSWLSEDDQKNAVDVAGTDKYQEYIDMGKELNGTAQRESRTDTKEPEGLITAATRISKKLYSSKKSFDKIYEDATYRRDLDDKQKAYISQLRTTMQAIEKLEVAERDMMEEEKEKADV